MKVKAMTNFAGEICMAAGEIRDVPESVAAPLLKCGYLENAEPQETTKPQETAEPAETTESVESTEPLKPKKKGKGKTEG